MQQCRLVETVDAGLPNGLHIRMTRDRDIYYRDPALFGSQSVVDRHVEDIAYTLDVPRSRLNITAAAKGLMAGAFKICFRDGSVLDARADCNGLLVPNLREVLSIDMKSVAWILVIEKEATFRSIAASPFWANVCHRGIIITGKGYPDLATRAMLHFMSAASPRNGFSSPPVHALMDFDPDGLAILSTFKHGSLARAHDQEGLCVPQLHWLGLRSDHMIAAARLSMGAQGLLALTPRDRRKAISMLDRRQACTDEDEARVRGALQTMLMLNLKAELQVLDVMENGMSDLLTTQLPDV